jgi:S1-C subfamily serine protease
VRQIKNSKATQDSTNLGGLLRASNECQHDCTINFGQAATPLYNPTIERFLKQRLALAAAVVMLTSTGCAWRVKEATRINSFKPFAGRLFGQDEVDTFLTSRVAFLVATDQFPTNAWLAGDRHIPTNSSLGCAAAIDRRGYFLTAAHCLCRKAVYLILYESNTNEYSIWVMRARVVWQGDYHAGQPDLAILRVRRMLDRTFDWADEVSKDEPVMAVGMSWTNANLRGFELMGGKVLDCGKVKGKEGYLELANDVPLQPGDSGGPLVDSAGRLVGINVEGIPPIMRWLLPGMLASNVTERPDRNWLTDLIEADVARQRAESAVQR